MDERRRVVVFFLEVRDAHRMHVAVPHMAWYILSSVCEPSYERHDIGAALLLAQKMLDLYTMTVAKVAEACSGTVEGILRAERSLFSRCLTRVDTKRLVTCARELQRIRIDGGRLIAWRAWDATLFEHDLPIDEAFAVAMHVAGVTPLDRDGEQAWSRSIGRVRERCGS